MSAPHAERVGAFSFLFRRLRLGDPWHYKAPLLISLPYFVLAAGAASFATAVESVLWSLCTIAGIAGFAYLSNDIWDRTADRAAGRWNATADLSASQVALACATFLTAAFVPWIVYVPLSPVSLGLLAAEFALLLAYSVPPLRLKERGGFGLIADALYAHAVPALVAVYSFHILTGRVYRHFILFSMTVVVWQFFFGLRSVLTHQLADATNDRAASASTWVIRRGEAASMRLLAFVLAPLELLAWAAFTVIVALTMPVVAVGWPVYVALKMVVRAPRDRVSESLCDRLDALLNEYYLRWLPLLILLGLCIRDPRMVMLLLLHLVIFRNGLTPQLTHVWEMTRSARARAAGRIVAAD